MTKNDLKQTINQLNEEEKGTNLFMCHVPS